MAKVLGLKEAEQAFKKIEKDAGKTEVEVTVGYTANYALYVHESVGMKLKGKSRGKNRGKFWDPQGRAQAKFLEAPARNNEQTYAKVIAETYKRTHNLTQAVYIAGLRLQADSQKLVPVDTGNLKATAFTKITS